MDTIKSTADSFLFNGKPYSQNFSVHPSPLGARIFNDIFDLFNGKLSEITIDGKFYNSYSAFHIAVFPIINKSSSSGTTSITDKIQELIDLTQAENDKTQELIEKTIEKPLIPIDFKLLAGTYTNANILSGKYSGSENKIHSIQILSEDVDAFSLDVVGDLEIITKENSQTLRAVKNAELPPFTLVVNTGFEVIINIELLTI